MGHHPFNLKQRLLNTMLRVVFDLQKQKLPKFFCSDTPVVSSGNGPLATVNVSKSRGSGLSITYDGTRRGRPLQVSGSNGLEDMMV